MTSIIHSRRILFLFAFASLYLSIGNPFAAAQLTGITLTQIDGSTLKGNIESIEASGRIIGNSLPPNLHLHDILGIETVRTTQQQQGFDIALLTIGDGKLRIRNPRIETNAVRFESASGLNELPLQNLRAIVWKASSNVEQQISSPSTADDNAIVETADGERSVNGIVEQLDADQLQINYQNESRKIGVSKINAIVMANLGLESPADSLATVTLTDGSTIVGAIVSLLDSQLNLQLAGEKTIPISTDKIVAISIQSDRLQFLSDLQPIDVQQRTEFAVQRSWQRDRSVENNRLAIRRGNTGQQDEFNKGIGTQAFSQLDFANSNQATRLLATVGIAAETNSRGDCQMVVRGDGIELWSQRVRGTDEPHHIELDIKGMKVISLIVYPGHDFDLADHANWANARFVKQ